MNIKTTVSFVIPVYNEADRIAACLQAVAGQTVQPLEVIVVDNNSTDGTAQLARCFPFVTVMHESRQGVVYARDRGFSAARGDIIARIDADTLIPADWTATVIDIFKDTSVGAVSGAVRYRDITAAKLVNRLDLFWRRRMARLLGAEVALQGANMALRRLLWTDIKHQVCHVRGQHEDFDIAIHARQAGYSVRFAERLQASVCYRQANYSFRAFSQYALSSPRTYLDHGCKSGRAMYQVVAFVVVLYPLISLMSRGFDERVGRFTMAKLWAVSVPPRVNPALFVD